MTDERKKMGMVKEKEERKKMGMTEDIELYRRYIKKVEEGLDELQEEREILERDSASSDIRRERKRHEPLMLGGGLMWALICSTEEVGAEYIEERGMERVLSDAGGFSYEITRPYVHIRKLGGTGERVLPDPLRETLRGLYTERERLEKEIARGRLTLEDVGRSVEQVYEFIPKLEGVLEGYVSSLRGKMRDRTSSD